MSFIVKAVKGVVNAVVGVAKAVVKAVVGVVKSVIDFAIQAFMPSMPGVDSANEAARQQGVLIQREGSDVNIPVVYGHRKMAGAVVYMETGSTNNRYLWVAYTFCEGLVEGLREIYIDDFLLNSKYIARLNGGQTVLVDEGKYKGRIRMRWSPGVYTATPNDTLNTAVRADVFAGAPNFTTNMLFNGVATLFVRYEWFEINTQEAADSNPFAGGVPKVQVCLLGRRVATLTTGSTSESYTYGAAGYTERYSTNPAECVLDYLRNPRYGKGLANSEINWDSFRTAAAKVNQQVTYFGTLTGTILSTNAVVDTGQSLFNNVKILLHGMRGYMPYVQGQYKLKIEDAGNPTDILSGSAEIAAVATTSTAIDSTDLGTVLIDVMGDITYTGIERSAKYTQVVVTYVDPDQGWSNQQVVWPETEAERLTYVSADGGRENALEVTMGTITNKYMALDFARLMFNKSRFQETATVTVSSKGIELEPGDNIRIQGTILNFSDTPYRIVSMTYNDNYTITLGCVRNPESIYPHTRLNEQDFTARLFRPFGSEIYEIGGGGTLGYIPPTTSPYVDSGFSGNTNPVNSNVEVVGDTINTAPAPAPAPTAPKNQTIDITRVTYTADANGSIYATLEFAQPDHSLYSGTDVYWKLSTSTVWQTLRFTDRPGAGVAIYARIGPLIIPSGRDAIPYDLRTRVLYSTGEFSTNFATAQFTPSAVSGTTATIVETIQITANAWTDPVTSAENRTDERIVVTGDVASLGAAGTPRAITFTVRQDIVSTEPDFEVAGVVIYYKVSTATYWERTAENFNLSYTPGVNQSFVFGGDTGVSGGPPNYDFIFRLRYKNAAESEYQYRTQIRVESPFATYPYNPFYGKSTTNELVTAFSFQTVDQAPPGAVVAATDTRLGISYIKEEVSNTVQFMRLLLLPPDVANQATYRGARISYRPVLAGQNPALTTFVDKQQINSAGTIGPIYISPILFDQTYELIITPQVSSGGTVINSNNSLYGSGLIHNRTSSANYPADSNWLSSFRMQQTDTNLALRTSSQTFAVANPTVSVTLCEGTTQAGSYTYADWTTTATSYVFRRSIRLQYNKSTIPGFERLNIYRRVNAGQIAGAARYYGIGQWEKIVVTDLTNPPNANGIVTVNLRNAVDYTEFEPYYQVPGYPTTTPLKKTIAVTNQGSRKPISQTWANTELLLVVETTGAVASGLGTYIKCKNFTTGPVNIISPDLPQIVDVAPYNSNFDTGYDRRLSDARSVLAASGVCFTYNVPDTTRTLIYPTLTPDLV